MDEVSGDEVLYRGIRDDQRRYSVLPDGTVRFTSEAFKDPERQPSVDRANLCGNDPAHSQRDQSDGVTSLVASEVRAIDDVGQTNKSGALISAYFVDVKPDPLENHPKFGTNLAHAVVCTDPTCRNDNEFRKLRRSLARLAGQRGWLIKPADLR